MLSAGDTLDGKYQIIRHLGQGRWGRVYLAENLKLGNRWAIKEINLAHNSRVNLLAEPDILKKLNHRSLPRIVDIIKTDDTLYIIEDYFEGKNLRELIKHRDLCTAASVIRWGIQLCEILVYLHALKPNPIIYRDMKPGNIIIDNDNDAKLIDFGIAREFKPEQDSDTTFIGTIGYAAPEQYCVGSRTDERTDIYGLGATLYHVLTGVNPNEHPDRFIPVGTLNSSFSTDIEQILDRCVQHNPDDRYQTAKEVLKDLQKACTLPSEAKNGGFLGKLRNQLRSAPDFSSRVVFVEKLVGTVIIAVGGTNRGVGCTYLSICLATFLRQNNYEVAVVELNDNPVFFALEDEDCSSGRLKGSFKKAGIDFYWQNDYNQGSLLSDALRAGYNFLIVDLGRLLKTDNMSMVEKSVWYDEINRAGLPILVSGAATWQIKDLAPCLNQPESNRWTLVFSAPGGVELGQLKKYMNNPTHVLNFNPDPFMPDKQQDAILKGIMASILPKKEAGKKSFKFWK